WLTERREPFGLPPLGVMESARGLAPVQGLNQPRQDSLSWCGATTMDVRGLNQSTLPSKSRNQNGASCCKARARELRCSMGRSSFPLNIKILPRTSDCRDRPLSIAAIADRLGRLPREHSTTPRKRKLLS